jgi:AbrB family looped-hinge helix DNA binding protein
MCGDRQTLMYADKMKGKLTIDEAGRIVPPRAVRDKLQVVPGDQLKMETDGDEITLRLARGAGQLRKKRGVWVYFSAEPLSASAVDETLTQVRRERDEQNLGKIR